MPEKLTKRGRGRPAHQPTAAQRRQVSIAAGGGMRHEDIAIALGIARDTLEKHYSHELTTVATMRRMEVLQGLHAAAKRGSSSAAKAYLAIEPQLAAPPAGAAAGDADPVPTKARPEGKKAQADADAKTAQVGTEWGDLLRTPPPALQ